MRREQNRILEMVAAGQLSPDEAERLLGAMRRPRASLWRWIFAPLELLSTSAALLAATAVAVAQLVVSRLHVRFDGALDSHVVPAAIPWSQALVDLALAWPLTALLFWLVARLVARQGRWIDFLAAVGLARLPLVAGGAMIGLFREPFLGAAAGEIDPALVVLALLSIPFVAWFFTLLVTGMRTASGLRGGRLALASVMAMVAAEIATKLLLLI